MSGPILQEVQSPRSPDARDRILESARMLFAERGADAVTMAEVAEAAGVARATVFNHFGSKHALIEGITEEALEAYQQLLQHAVANETESIMDIVRALFAAMATGIERDRELYRGVFREITNLAVGLDEGGPGQRARQRNLATLRQLMARGQSTGELTPRHSPADLASALSSLLAGTVIHWLYEDRNDPLPDRMRRAAVVFLDGARCRSEEERV